MAEDKAMDFPKRGSFEWNFNTIVTMGGILASIIATAVGYGVLAATLTNNDENLRGEILRIHERFQQYDADRKERVSGFQSDLRAVNQQLTIIPTLTVQLEQARQIAIENKQRIEETDRRIDRVVESIGSKIDTVNENVNKVATRVEVVGSKVDDLKKTDSRTGYNTPILRP